MKNVTLKLCWSLSVRLRHFLSALMRAIARQQATPFSAMMAYPISAVAIRPSVLTGAPRNELVIQPSVLMAALLSKLEIHGSTLMEQTAR